MIDATGTAVLCCCCAVLLLCCPAAIDTGSSSKAAVPLWQAAERATVRAQLVLSFAYDDILVYTCNAHYCCLYCVVEVADTLSFPTSISIPPYHTLSPCTRYQVSHTGAKNRSYEYSHLRIMHHTRTKKSKTRHQVPRITRRACFQTFVLDREHSLPQRHTRKTYQVQHIIHIIPSM